MTIMYLFLGELNCCSSMYQSPISDAIGLPRLVEVPNMEGFICKHKSYIKS